MRRANAIIVACGAALSAFGSGASAGVVREPLRVMFRRFDGPVDRITHHRIRSLATIETR